MSRIHEALKKAEQERASRPRAPMDLKTAADSEISSPPAEAAASGAFDLELPVTGAGLDEGSDQLTLEMIQTQVKKLTWHPDPKTMLFFGQEAYAFGTEEFRTLRSHLYAFRELEPLRTVLITSAAPGEGKSFISANLAQILVQQPGERVLLIDADLRWSRLHLILGTPATPGLTEYLSGEVNELSAIQRGPLDNLFFIPGGRHAANPSEIIANGRLKELLRRLSPLFDWVIVDSPPAMAVSDPRVMAEMCDGILLVVGAGMQPFDAVQKARQQFSSKRLLGAVLNRAEPRASYSYKYYGYYGGKDKQ